MKEVKQLLSTSVDINSRTKDVRVVCFQLLLVQCCLYCHCSQMGYTALFLASLRGHVEVVRLLVNAQASVIIPSKVLNFNTKSLS